MSERLALVVGPSGAGKDSCLAWALANADQRWPLIKAHRYCTRPHGPGEDHVPLTMADWRRRRDLGCFALHWEAHGLGYGVGIEIDHWLAVGATVLVNGSRAALAQALGRYPNALVAHITADPDVRARRLADRGREDAADIEQRLRREVPLALPPGVRSATITNNGDLADAGARLLATLSMQAPVFISDF